MLTHQTYLSYLLYTYILTSLDTDRYSSFTCRCFAVVKYNPPSSDISTYRQSGHTFPTGRSAGLANAAAHDTGLVRHGPGDEPGFLLRGVDD